MTNHSGEPEFDSWWEQFLARLYLPSSRTPVYCGPLPLGTGGLTPKKSMIMIYAG